MWNSGGWWRSSDLQERRRKIKCRTGGGRRKRGGGGAASVWQTGDLWRFRFSAAQTECCLNHRLWSSSSQTGGEGGGGGGCTAAAALQLQIQQGDETKQKSNRIHLFSSLGVLMLDEEIWWVFIVDVWSRSWSWVSSVIRNRFSYCSVLVPQENIIKIQELTRKHGEEREIISNQSGPEGHWDRNNTFLFIPAPKTTRYL